MTYSDRNDSKIEDVKPEREPSISFPAQTFLPTFSNNRFITTSGAIHSS